MSNSLQLERRPVSALRPSPHNAKLHPDEQIEHIAASITQNGGFLDPIEIDPTGEIIVGEGRWRAAIMAGLDEVPVIVHTFMNERDKRAYMTANNQTTLMTGLDMDMVANEFARLDLADDEYASLGFTLDEVIFMMPEQAAILSDDTIAKPMMDTSAWDTLVPKAIRTRVLFDDQLQQARFEQFANHLREVYPETSLLSERIVRFVEDYCHEGEAL